MPALKTASLKLFTKTVITKGYGFHTPQDGSVCKIKVISDEENIITDLDLSSEKDIIVGDVDEPIDRIIEDCIRTMKEEEVCCLKFEHPLFTPDFIIPVESDPVAGNSAPESSKSAEGKPEVTKNEIQVEKSETEPEANADQKTEVESEAESKSEEAQGEVKPEGSEDVKSEAADEQQTETKPEGNEDQEAGAKSEAVNDQETHNSNEEDNENIPSSNAAEVKFQLLSYTREPEIWEMSVTEKWRRACYHKQRGLELYSRGAYQYAFRRFGLTLKYVISLEHDVPAGQEDGMDIKGLKLSCYLNVAACQMRHHSFESVVANSSKALLLQPNNAKALYRRGSAHLQLQEYEKAKEDLMLAQSLEPKNQAVAKQLQLLKCQVQKLNQYYASAMKKLFT